MVHPKLRFKREDGTEFPNYEAILVGDVTLFHKQGYYTNQKYVEQGVKIARVSDLFNPNIVYSNMPMVYMSKEEYCSYKIEENDFLIARSGSIGRYGIVKTIPHTERVIFGSFIIKFVFDNKKMLNSYFGQFYDSDKVIKQLAKITQKGANVNINAENIKKIRIDLPCLEEQQKIADFLSTVDKIIAQSEAEVQNLEQQKKAAMQKIFSQEVRFRREDGTAFPEWEESTLGRECDFINGRAHENCETENGRYIIVNSKFISTNGEVKRKTNTILEHLYIDDIVMVMSDVPNGKAMSKCFVIKENDKYTLNQRICALRTKHNSMYISNQISRCKYFMLFDDGVKQTNLRKQDVLGCPISIPCLEEQQKIADFLSAYDEAIACAKQELDKWKELKKGMLQQMFV